MNLQNKLAHLLGCSDFDLTYNQQLILKSCSQLPHKIISFQNIKETNDFNQFVYFENTPKVFENLWNNFEEYTKILLKFSGVIQPDFCSFDLKCQLPLKMVEFENLRSRMMVQLWQKKIMNVVPTVIYGKEQDYISEPYNKVMEGLPKESIFSFQTKGISADNLKDFEAGVKVVINMYNPIAIVFIGPKVNFKFNIEKYVQCFFYEVDI